MNPLPLYTEIDFPPDAIRNPMLRRFYDWLDDVGMLGGISPVVTPGEVKTGLPEIMPHLYLVDVSDPASGRRLDYVGRHIAKMIGDRTGQDTNERSANYEFHKLSMEVFDAVALTREAVHAGPRRSAIPMVQPGGSGPALMESLNIPMAARPEAGDVEFILGAVVFSSTRVRQQAGLAQAGR